MAVPPKHGLSDEIIISKPRQWPAARAFVAAWRDSRMRVEVVEKRLLVVRVLCIRVSHAIGPYGVRQEIEYAHRVAQFAEGLRQAVKAAEGAEGGI